MKQTYSLYELTSSVQEAVSEAFPDSYWVTAEISELRVNASGHCYLELVEKAPSGNSLLARARAIIWNNLYPSLKACFEEETEQQLTRGIKVLVQARVDFHPLYGFSLTITDIDPSYTMGDLARRRREILKQLQEDGILDMNKELPFPELPQRIAVISSDTAAGYGDFCGQLANNTHRFAFYPTLFPAVMQGDRVASSIIQALNHICDRMDDFDVVVIIRGGGATTDLAGFDNLALAENCAQFPLPIITGIGHERDDTVIDLISHTRVKTPTAAAEFLVTCMSKAEERLLYAISALTDSCRERMEQEKTAIDRYRHQIPLLFTVARNNEGNRLQQLNAKITNAIRFRTSQDSSRLQFISQRLRMQSSSLLGKENLHLQMLQEKVKSADPEHILKQGYTLTLKNGKTVKTAESLQPGDQLTTRFAKGEITSTVN